MKSILELEKEWLNDPEYLLAKEMYAEEFRLYREKIEADMRFKNEYEKNQLLCKQEKKVKIG